MADGLFLFGIVIAFFGTFLFPPMLIEHETTAELVIQEMVRVNAT